MWLGVLFSVHPFAAVADHKETKLKAQHRTPQSQLYA